MNEASREEVCAPVLGRRGPGFDVWAAGKRHDGEV